MSNPFRQHRDNIPSDNSSFRQHLDDGKDKPTRWYSNKQEKTVASTIGGKKTPNSGATAYVKGDVRTDIFTIECKTKKTKSESISIKKEWLTHLKDEARLNSTPYSALVVNFGPDTENYAVIDMTLFNILQDYLRSEDTEE